MVVGSDVERMRAACGKEMNNEWTHLRELESESIYILRETVAQFRNPVLLYSVGKDSSVLVHLARKAFYPGPLPFPFLHVDTGYKFKEMLEFRDRFTKEIGARLIVHRNEDAIAAIEADVRRLIDQATEACKAAPPPPADILFSDVYADGGFAWRN